MLICLLPKPPIDFFSIKKRSGQKNISFGKGGRGEAVRETVERQQYTSIVPSSKGATVHKLGQKYKP
jgi:hypothetical protein